VETIKVLRSVTYGGFEYHIVVCQEKSAGGNRDQALEVLRNVRAHTIYPLSHNHWCDYDHQMVSQLVL
jgi:hypothetical protein